MDNDLLGFLSSQSALQPMAGVPGLAGSLPLPTGGRPTELSLGPRLNPALPSAPSMFPGIAPPSGESEEMGWMNDPKMQQLLLSGLGGVAGGLGAWRAGKQMAAERNLARGVSDRANARWNQAPVRKAEGGWMPEEGRQIDTSNIGYIRYLLGQMQGRPTDWFPTDPRPEVPMEQMAEPSQMDRARENVELRKASLNYAEGGLSRYMKGGTPGQSDKIPALLSDGEYVIDADTVAALGDGNNAAGASALDQMRQNIRKHKRSAPADKIPPKAKAPTAYLKKGAK